MRWETGNVGPAWRMIKRMPELPDVTIYVERMAARLVGHAIERVTIAKPFVLRTVDPPIEALVGRPVVDVRRLGKRIVLALDGDLYLIFHLMIAGRLRWRDTGLAAPTRKGKPGTTGTPAVPPRLVLASLAAAGGTLYFTEAGTTRRASLHLVQGTAALEAFDRGGLEILDADAAAFAARLRSENHTLKRALTDPRLFSGVGNAYSDEILHRARLSPLALTGKLSPEHAEQLHRAARDVLTEWTARLRADVGQGFPETVTAFRDGMAVHGRFGRPCPVCGTPVQRIRYAANETNYCARCQTGGRLLADRALSRLLRQDWPRSIDDVE